MSEKGGKGKIAVSRGKSAAISAAAAPAAAAAAAPAAPLDKTPGSLKGKKSGSSKRSNQVVLESSDSDSEGFIEEKCQTPSTVNGKTPSDVKSSKKKVTFDGLKSGGASLDTPISRGNLGKGGSGKAGGKGSLPYSGKGGKGSLPKATPLKVPVTEAELKLEIELPKNGNAQILMDCEAADILQGIQEHLPILLEDPDIKIPESFDKALEYSKLNNHYTNVKSVTQVLDTLKSSGVTPGEICMIGNICPENAAEAYALVPSLKVNRHKNEESIVGVLAELAKFKTLE